MPAPILERRALNEEIERAFIDTSLAIREILCFGQTFRQATVTELYEAFFRGFSYLVVLTCNLDQIQKGDKARVDKAVAWIRKELPNTNDAILKARSIEGIDMFMEYSNLLSDQNVIALSIR